MAQLFFILGQGRAATGLLAQLLARHSRIAIAPDSLFVVDLQRKYGAGSWTRRRIDAFCRDLGRLFCMPAWRLDTRRLALRLYERQSRLTYAEVCRQVYTSYAEDSLERRATRWVGEQNPLYALQIERLDSLLPAARYLHVTRDYREEIFDRVQRSRPLAAVASPTSRPGRAGRVLSWLARRSAASPAALAQRWKAYNQRILDLTRHAPERSLWLRHEDLLAYPEHELARICRFLDLAFEPEVLAEPMRWPPAPSGASARGPTQGGSAHWQQLPEPTLRQAEAICGEFAERFGYRASTHGRGGVSLPVRLLTLCGSTSVAAERLAVRIVPAGWRKHLIGAYLRLENSLRSRELSGEALP